MKGLSNPSLSLPGVLWLFFATGTDQYHWLIDPRIFRIDAIVWHTYKHRHAAMQRRMSESESLHIINKYKKLHILWKQKRRFHIPFVFRAHMCALHAMWAGAFSFLFASRSLLVHFLFLSLPLLQSAHRQSFNSFLSIFPFHSPAPHSSHNFPSHIILSLQAT